METKFTKGEWSYNGNTIMCDSSGIAIVYLKNFNLGRHIGKILKDEEAESNAKLIASAPCLLEALQYGKQISEKLRFPTEEELKQFVNMATEAIKKATE